MAKKISPLFPATELRLQQLGERLRLARLRRRLTGKPVAERAGMTPITLRSLERGSSGVTIGAYVAVMQVLGAESDLDLLLANDPVGRNLQDAALPRRARMTRPISALAARPAHPTSAPVPTLQEPAVNDNWAADDSFVSTDELLSLIKIPETDAPGVKPRPKGSRK